MRQVRTSLSSCEWGARSHLILSCLPVRGRAQGFGGSDETGTGTCYRLVVTVLRLRDEDLREKKQRTHL